MKFRQAAPLPKSLGGPPNDCRLIIRGSFSLAVPPRKAGRNTANYIRQQSRFIGILLGILCCIPLKWNSTWTTCRKTASSNRTGLTLIEVMIALAVIAVVIAASIGFTVLLQKTTIMNQNRSFGMQKAIAILSELRSYVESKDISGGAAMLDIFDDGISRSPLLTTDNSVFDPANVVSGNVREGDHWRYLRQITIRRSASFQDSTIRIVRVKIFLDQPGSTTEEVLADLSSVVFPVVERAVTSQVFDVYLLKVANIPGWWDYSPYVQTLAENAFVAMQTLNPGLSFRLHLITKPAYGRDQEYTPYINFAEDSTQPINYVYFYPGTLPVDSKTSQYYSPESFLAHINVDGATFNDYNTANSHPYALADQYNHAMRWPAEKALYDERLADGLEKEAVLTYRLFLDDMIANPAKYRNAIIINLHGDLLPMPALRNYSDAAKDPAEYPFWRAVTHPEKLRSALADNIKLRVYAYLTDPAVTTSTMPSSVPISIVIPNVNLTQAGDINIAAIKGGVPIADTYAIVNPAPAIPSSSAMYSNVSYVAAESSGYTLIELYNTPLKTPLTSDNSGLDTTRRLYGLDYIPCPVEAANDFSQNLATTGAAIPKNTARWIITISKAAADREWGADARILEFQTRIGNDLTTGIMWPVKNKPSNLSTTYTWRSNTIDSVPFSERYQFQGDPRHCPYADVKSYHGYNWYFDNMSAGSINALSEWPGFDGARINNSSANADGWHGKGGTTGEMLEIDVPRFYALLRTALTGANCVFSNVTGFSFFYMGLGNEIGYDSVHGFPTSIPVSVKPFTGAESGTRNENSITADAIGSGGNTVNGGVKYVRENVSPYWWSMSWLGELYPDMDNSGSVNIYSTQWAISGNLYTGIGNGTFVRILRRDMNASGTPQVKANSWPLGTAFGAGSTQADVNLACVRRTNLYGCTSFYNIGTYSSTFRHNIPATNSLYGTKTAAGTEMATNFKLNLHASELISRPFKLNNNWGAVPTEFSSADYTALRCSAAVLPATGYTSGARFYNHQDGATWEGSSIVRLQNPAGSNAFISVNGLDITAQSGNQFIAQYAIMTAIQGFMLAGLPAIPNRIIQLPRVEIMQPNATSEFSNPDVIDLLWKTTWARWDKQPYAAPYSPSFSENEQNLRYALLYSTDNGTHWFHMIDQSPATSGVPNQSLWLSDAHTGQDEKYAWDVSNEASFVEGNYLIMVEAYRYNIPSHNSFHQQTVYIQK